MYDVWFCFGVGQGDGGETKDRPLRSEIMIISRCSKHLNKRKGEHRCRRITKIKVCRLLRWGPGLVGQVVMADVEWRFIYGMAVSSKWKGTLTILFYKGEPAHEFWPQPS
jgi:hypothetical protein